MTDTTKSLINEYLQITGRPAATLTVDEYISFLNINPFFRETRVKTTKENEINPHPIVSHSPTKESPTPKENEKVIDKPQADNNTKANRQTVLQMLKSVGG